MLKTRIGDIAVGICIYPPPIGAVPSTGVVVTGNPTDLSLGPPTAGIGDIVMWPCGPGTIVFAIPNDISLMPRSHLGAPVMGGNNSGTIVTGNPLDISL